MKSLITAIKIFLVFTLLTGVIYPVLITGIAQMVFPLKANGSLIIKDGIVVGSKLIGQQFESDLYFTSRPSAVNYNPIPSGASNYGLTNKVLKKAVEDRRRQFVEFNRISSNVDIPSEMLFSSASGLDPHISNSAASLQIDRIAKARNYNYIQKLKLIKLLNSMTESPQFFCLGDERVNVLLLNLKLDGIR